MPARRDADGNLVIEESRKVGNVEVRPDEPTASRPDREAAPGRPRTPTRTRRAPLPSRSRTAAGPTEPAGDARTRIYRPGARPPQPAPETPAAATRP